MAWWVAATTLLTTALAVPAPVVVKRDADTIMKIISSIEVGRNNAIESLIIDTLEDFRETMLTGTDSLPVMDPFAIDRIYVDDSIIPIPGARLEMQGLVISNLSTFNIKEVAVSSASIILQRYNVLLEIDIPEVDIRADHYDLFGSLSGLNLYGTGNAYFSITKPELAVNGLVGLRLGLGSITLNIVNLHLGGGVGGISINITGWFNDPSLDSFVNLFLESLVMQILEFYGDGIADFISPLVRDLANDILSDINLIDILTK